MPFDPAPRNRQPECLDPLAIEIVHANGRLMLDPNGLAIAIQRNHGAALLRFRTIPDLHSILSGGPAVLFRTDDLEIALTPEELGRLAARTLTLAEYTALGTRFGMFFDIHGDYYDPETGESVQPRLGPDPGAN